MSGRRPPQASLPDKETRYRADTTVAITEPGGGRPVCQDRPHLPGYGGRKPGSARDGGRAQRMECHRLPDPTWRGLL